MELPLRRAGRGHRLHRVDAGLAPAGEAGRDGRFLPRYVIGCALVCGLLPPYRTPAGNMRSDVYSSPVVRRGPGDVATQRRAIAFIGRDPRLKVAAQDRMLPALAGRPQVYMLDRASEADWLRCR